MSVHIAVRLSRAPNPRAGMKTRSMSVGDVPFSC